MMVNALDPRLRALYLALVAIGVFFMPAWWMVAIVLAVQVTLWLSLGLGAAALTRQLRKLTLFLAVILIAFSLVGHDPASDRWHALVLPWLEIEINLTGAMLGLTMVLRVLAVVLCSQVARAGDARALAAGLGKLGVPRIVALSIDSVLTLLGGTRGKGKGMGRGTGGGKGRGGRSARGFWAGIKRLARGDVSVLVDQLFRHVDRVEDHVAKTLESPTEDAHVASDAAPDSSPETSLDNTGTAPTQTSRDLARDVAVISGIALTMLGIKALKLLPGLPFAPGHKGVILIPLFIDAGFMTRSRFGATITGCTMGTVAFLLGDGRYGIFEIAKHITPGLLVDLFMPFMRSLRGRGRSVQALAWPIFGIVIALGRFATVTAIALTVQAPALVYALLLPGLAIHGLFGALSGLVAVPLLAALDRADRARRTGQPDHPGHDSGPEAETQRGDGTGRGRGRGGGQGRGDGTGRGGGRGGGQGGGRGGQGRGDGTGRGGGTGRGNGKNRKRPTGRDHTANRTDSCMDEPELTAARHSRPNDGASQDAPDTAIDSDHKQHSLEGP